ncbi:MAG: sugar phosphate isomerase/epimerase [Clostridiales bacterium]|nr:MAG: sugar phosphate isomerase/epimerase [Clostridiales bacterium]
MTNRKNWPVGLSTSHFGSLAHRESEVFSEYRKAGIRVAELSQTYEALVEAGFYDRPKRISDAAAAEGVTLRSLHLPFSKALHIDHPDDEADRAAVDTYRRSMHAAAEAGIRVFVVHPSYEPIGGDRPQRMERSRSNLALLVREAESLGARLCVENLPRTCLLNSSAEMIDCLKAVPGLYMCFDSNHLLGEANPDFLRLLYEAGLAGRIGNVHISDYDFIDERHELPGNGKNDWPAIIAGLEKLDYDGPFLYEPHANSPGRAVITPAMVAESRDRLLGEGV